MTNPSMSHDHLVGGTQDMNVVGELPCRNSIDRCFVASLLSANIEKYRLEIELGLIYQNTVSEFT